MSAWTRLRDWWRGYSDDDLAELYEWLTRGGKHDLPPLDLARFDLWYQCAPSRLSEPFRYVEAAR